MNLRKEYTCVVNEHCGELKINNKEFPRGPEDYINYESFINMIKTKQIIFPSKIKYDQFVSKSAREEFEETLERLRQNFK